MILGLVDRHEGQHTGTGSFSAGYLTLTLPTGTASGLYASGTVDTLNLQSAPEPASIKKPTMLNLNLKDPEEAKKDGITQRQDGIYIGEVKILDNDLLVR